MSISRTNDFSSSSSVRLGLSKTSATSETKAAEAPKATEATTPTAEAAPEKTAASATTVDESRGRALAGEDAIRARLLGTAASDAPTAGPRRGLGDDLQLAANQPKPKPRPRPTGSQSMAENNKGGTGIPGLSDVPETQLA